MNESKPGEFAAEGSTARTWFLAAVGGLAGLASWGVIHHTTLTARPEAAAHTWLWVLAAALAYTFGSLRPRWSLVFSAGAASIMALIMLWNGLPGPYMANDDVIWRLLSAAVALAVALPIFQTIQEEGSRSLPYPLLHRHAWSNVVIGFGTVCFAAVLFILMRLLGELFHLIGVDLVRDTLGKPWFISISFGAAAAAGVSLLRDWSHIVGSLQRVVMAVLGVLSPILGFALLLFLLFLPFTGLAPLWGATKATTPIILGVILLSLLLANAVLADGNEHGSRSPILRAGAMALGAVILPLAVIAAVSTGLRIGQYGLTPDRCWAVIFVAFAVANGATYAWALARRRGQWAAAVRLANVRLALAIGGVALFLAMPILDFQTLSTRSQVNRLLEGQVSVAQFDFAALKFNLGEPGRRALKDLRTISGRPDAAAIRAEVAWTDRLRNSGEAVQNRVDPGKYLAAAVAAVNRISVYPKGSALPEALKTALVDDPFLPDVRLGRTELCAHGQCAIILSDLAGDRRREALLFTRFCSGEPCATVSGIWHETSKGWEYKPGQEEVANIDSDAFFAALAAGRFETRSESVRTFYVDGRRVEFSN